MVLPLSGAEMTRKRQRRARLEADALVRAIQSGGVDAVVMSGPHGDQIYTLSGAEHPYRVMVEAMSEGAIMLTPDGTIFYSNRRFAAMLGLSLDQVIGSAMSRFVVPEDLPRYRWLIGQATGGTGRDEVRLMRTGNVILPAYLSISSFVSAASAGFCLVVTDLTDHLRHQALLAAEAMERAKRSEAEACQLRVTTILESITDSFFTVDRAWRITDVNHRAAAAFGRRRDQLIGRSFWSVAQRKAPELWRQYRKAMDDGVIVHHEGPAIIAHDRWFEQHIYPSNDGLAVYFRDITARKRAEDTLRRSEALLTEGQRLTQTGSWILDVTTDELSWSVEHYRLWGVTPATFALTPTTAMSFVHPEDRIPTASAFEEALREPVDFEREFRIIRPDGAVRQIFSAGRPVFSDTGEYVAYVGTVLDITDRKAAERMRAELGRCLIAAQEDERRRIALEMHDEFGQQLSTLVLLISALKRDVGRRLRYATQLEVLEGIARQLDRDLEHIVGRLRPTALDDLGLVAALSHYVKHWSEHFQVSAQLHTTGMESYRLSSEVETALYRISQEALNNVAKHAQAKHVSILLDHRGDRVSIIIEDDGIGFDSEQLVDSRQRFGLVGMRERATLLGGTVDIESHTGIGTTVVIRLSVKAVTEQDPK